MRSHTESKARTPLGPVVTGATLAKDEVVRSEERTEGSRAERIHGTRLEVDQDGARDILIRGYFVIVDINSFKLKFVGPLVDTIRSDTMLVGHGLPELGTYEDGSRDHEYSRRRDAAVAIAHRFDYRTVEVRKISMKQRCAGSWGTA